MPSLRDPSVSDRRRVLAKLSAGLALASGLALALAPFRFRKANRGVASAREGPKAEAAIIVATDPRAVPRADRGRSA